MIRSFNIDLHFVLRLLGLGESHTKNMAWSCKLIRRDMQLLFVVQRDCGETIQLPRFQTRPQVCIDSWTFLHLQLKTHEGYLTP